MRNESICRKILVLLALGCFAVPAQATFHLMQIEQVIGGVNGDTTAQAIQLRQRSSFQNLVAPARIRAWDATGANPIVVADFTASVPNGASGARILVATASFLSLTTPTTVADAPMAAAIPASYLAAGSLTFESDSGAIVYWRLSWGGASYTGSTTGNLDNDSDGQFGPPFAGPLPSSTLQALRFTGTAAAPSTNNAANYALTAGAAVFTNNAGNSFTLVEQVGACCDDGTGDCTEAQDQASCESGGGRYGGNGSTCANINPPCIGPVGACCNDSTGECDENQTQTACTNSGGRYGGDDSTCGTINPACIAPTGACCSDNTGVCTEAQTQVACTSGGGRYGGDDATCFDIDPPCLEPPLAISLEVVASGMASPIHITHAGDGSGRLFIVDQIGLIRVLDADANLLPTPFLDVTAKLPTLGSFFDERGLLGMAFHPDYASNGRFFIRYSAPRASTGSEPCDLSGFNPGCHKEVLAEYHVTGDPTVNNEADPNSEIILFEVDEPQFNHNSGMVEFGPDGYLYFTLGDGGGAHDGLADGDPPGSAPTHGPIGNGQNIETPLGSMIRIDVDSAPTPPLAYAIPPDNPFVGVAGLDEIYAYGFRNPFRFSFDDGPGGTGELYVADVGQNLYEEVDIVELGGNYGWVIREGFECFDPFDPGNPPPSCPTTGAMGEPLLDPVVAYSHAEGGLAIVGGYVYRGTEYPSLVRRYVYGDFSADFGPTGRIYYFDTTGVNAFVHREFDIAPDGEPLGLFLKGMGEDANGELYIAVSADLAPSGTSGAVMRVTPPIIVDPDPLSSNTFGTCAAVTYSVCDTTNNTCGGNGPCEPCNQVRYLSFKIPDAGGVDTAIRIRLDDLHNPVPPPIGSVPDFAQIEGQDRYLNTVAGTVNRCCNPNSNPTSCNTSVNCNSDADCGGLGLNTTCYKNLCSDSTAFASFFRCAKIGCTPQYRDWSDFAGLVTYATGDAVIPSSTYSVSHLAANCAGNEAACAGASTALVVPTERWGNVDCSNASSGIPNAVDISRVVDKVRDLSGAFSKSRTHLRLATLDPISAVNALDIGRIVDAAKGAQYPFHINCTSACNSNAQCQSGVCIGAPSLGRCSVSNTCTVDANCSGLFGAHTCSANGRCTTVKDTCSGLCKP